MPAMPPQPPTRPLDHSAHPSERGRRTAGCVLYGLSMFFASALLLVLFLLPPLASKDPGAEYAGMFTGAVLALPAMFIYLWLPWILDRYDPEPVWALLVAVSWGAVVSCGFAATINSVLGAIGAEVGGAKFGEAVSACISAPIFEELFKGLGVFGMFFFIRRQFDGVVDAIIYASFIALGFAGVENILYYGRAATAELTVGAQADGALMQTVMMRGFMTPWLHPLFTSMTGIGFGLARESEKGWVRWLAPLLGYGLAVFLHAVWNTAATLSGMLVLVMLPLWVLFLLGFGVLLIVLVVRKGRIIRDHLKDEVLLGILTQAELELVTSAFATWRATFGWGGAPARDFVKAAARLALSKWHAARAWRGGTQTVSGDFVGPLRKELARLRAEMARALGRPLPVPQPQRFF